MKNKTTLIQGIIICTQGILLDAFSLYAIIPLLGNIWFGDLYGDEKSVTIFSLLIWLGISIGASIAVNIGKKKVIDFLQILLHIQMSHRHTQQIQTLRQSLIILILQIVQYLPESGNVLNAEKSIRIT